MLNKLKNESLLKFAKNFISTRDTDKTASFVGTNSNFETVISEYKKRHSISKKTTAFDWLNDF